MSDGIGNARRERRQLTEWLEENGWKDRSKSGFVLWVDPLSPDSEHWFHDAVRIQEAREEAVKRTMES